MPEGHPLINKMGRKVKGAGKLDEHASVRERPQLKLRLYRAASEPEGLPKNVVIKENLVDEKGFEPSASSLRTRRSPS
jgi:hypothetical protein